MPCSASSITTSPTRRSPPGRNNHEKKRFTNQPYFTWSKASAAAVPMGVLWLAASRAFRNLRAAGIVVSFVRSSGVTDCSGGSAIVFFWWRDAPPVAPGIPSVRQFPGNEKNAIGSMNHLALHMDGDKLDAAIGRLRQAGVRVIPIVVNHDDSETTVSPEEHAGVFVRSVYFTDPNGIMMEFAANTRVFGTEDVRHVPVGAALAG